jgi:hypothetical protein
MKFFLSAVSFGADCRSHPHNGKWRGMDMARFLPRLPVAVIRAAQPA